MTGRPKLICFDWDGTLVDSFDKIARCIVETAKEMNLKQVSQSAIKAKIGISLEELLDTSYGKVNYSEFQRRYEQIYLDLAPPLLYPNCVKMLQKLKRSGILLAIVSNKSRLSVEAELEATNVAKYFDSIWVAEEFAAKPSPIMFHHVMTSYQLGCEDVWMVGDSLPDLHAAYAASLAKIILVEKLPVPKWITQAEIISNLEEISEIAKAATLSHV